MKKILIIFLLLIFSSLKVGAVEEIKKGDILYLKDCINIAVENSPVIKKAEKKLLIAYKNVNIAKADYFPTLNTSLSFNQKVNSTDNYDDGLNNRKLPVFDIYIKQLIYNFGQTSSLINQQKFYKISAEHEYIEAVCNTINDVKLKYLKVLLTKSAWDIEKNNVEISTQMLNMTKKFYDENKKSLIDYINAQNVLSNSKLKLADAENAHKQAFVDLTNSMYIAGITDFEIKNIDTFDYYDAFFSPIFIETPKGEWHKITNRPHEKGLGNVQKFPYNFNEICEIAYNNSPDIKSLKAIISAMEQSSLNIKRKIYPSLELETGYKYDHYYRNDIDKTISNNQLRVGVSMKAGINAMKYKNELQKADLMIDLTKTDFDLLKQDIYFNVKRQYFNLITAEQQVENAKDKVNKAIENFTESNREYIAGKIGYLEFQAARQDYNQSKIDYIKQLYDYNTSLAKLEKESHKNIEKIYEIADKNLAKNTKIKLETKI